MSGFWVVLVVVMMIVILIIMRTMMILLALADMVYAIGNPETVVRFVSLVLLREGCHLVPVEHSQYQET